MLEKIRFFIIMYKVNVYCNLNAYKNRMDITSEATINKNIFMNIRNSKSYNIYFRRKKEKINFFFYKQIMYNYNKKYNLYVKENKLSVITNPNTRVI